MPNTYMIKSLNGEWLFKETSAKEYLQAKVPGCNFLDLMANHVISDPFVGTNEYDAAWVAEKDWEYIKTFELTADELSAKRINLNCKMLDTICDIYVNGSLIGNGKNCHIAYSFSVKDSLVVGKNEVKIIFHSPKEYVEEMYKQCPTPVNSNGQNGIVHIRKPQYHFGWDWGPVLTPSGISGDIELEFINGDILKDMAVTQSHDNGKVTLSVVAQVNRLSGQGDCEISVTRPDGEVFKQSGTSAEFVIEKPELWWTKELSEKSRQPLYTVSAAIFENGEQTNIVSKKIGLRTIELNREKDEFGRNFQFILNGVPLFIEGANYIPPDSFMNRFDKTRLDALLDAAEFSNMNMLRIWGGGFYGSDELYDACDERGILVWQDFCFACQAYPFFMDEFLTNVLEEVKYTVSRISHHPSLALWCGNNEIEDMHMAWVYMRKFVEWTEKFFYHILPDEIRKYDTQTPYTQGSPIGSAHNENVGSDSVGDTHIWGVWHGLQPMNYYRKRMTRFCSEFGFESLPDMKTIKAFASPEEYALSSKVMKSHQKCINGNDKMIYYIASRFRLPKKTEDLVYLSQITQQECIADATEHWRRNKGRCNGSMYWQFNDCWPVCSWSSYDYFGNYKALQYTAKHFNAPVSVSVENSESKAEIYLLNDSNKSVNAEIEYEIFDFKKGTIKAEKKEETVKAVSNKKIFSVSIKGFDKKNTAVAARLYLNGEKVMQKTVLFLPEKRLNLPKAEMDISVKKLENEIRITLKSNKFARLVKIENDSLLPFSDNYFDLLPNETRIITQAVDESVNQMDTIRLKSICDIESGGNIISDKIKRIKVYFSPVNIANAVHHSKVPKN